MSPTTSPPISEHADLSLIAATRGLTQQEAFALANSYRDGWEVEREDLRERLQSESLPGSETVVRAAAAVAYERANGVCLDEETVYELVGAVECAVLALAARDRLTPPVPRAIRALGLGLRLGSPG